MVAWTSWKPFPEASSRASIEAPVGPGLFEIRRISTGNVMAFEHSSNVARTLQSIVSPRMRLFAPRYDAHDLEYRTCAAPTSVDAKAMASRLDSQRRLFWRQALQI